MEGGGSEIQNEIQPTFEPIADVRRTAKLIGSVENEARDAAESFDSLVASLRSAMNEVSSSTLEHLVCYNEAAGNLQNACIEASSKGNKFVNSCLRLNEEVKDINPLAAQIKLLRQAVDQLEHQTNRHLSRA